MANIEKKSDEEYRQDFRRRLLRFSLLLCVALFLIYIAPEIVRGSVDAIMYNIYCMLKWLLHTSIGLRWVIGLAVSLLAGHYASLRTTNYLRDRHGFEQKYEIATVVLGIFERLAYTLTILNGFSIFIGVWFALKIFAGWTPASNETPQTRAQLINIFLVGNLVSLLFGFLGAWIIRA